MTGWYVFEISSIIK